jgi:hypothetical protein
MSLIQEDQMSATLEQGIVHPSKGPVLHPVTLLPSGLPEESALAILNLIKANEAHHPIHWPAWKRWGIVIIYCLLQVFVCLPGTSYISIEPLIQDKWGGRIQVVTLGQSLFVLGTAVGPVFLGPLS